MRKAALRSSSGAELSVPAGVPLFALALALSAGLPLLPDGRSFLALVTQAWGRSPLEAAWLLMGMGAPFVFGLFGFAAGLVRHPERLEVPLLLGVVLLHAQMLLIGMVGFLSAGQALAGGALFGVAVVSVVSLLWRTCRGHMHGRGLGAHALLRWGFLLIVMLTAWLRLQWGAGLQLGFGVDMVCLCALGPVIVLGRQRFGAHSSL